jgi:hypothetical protein
VKCKFNVHITCKEVGQHCNTCRIFIESGQALLVIEKAVVVETKKCKGHTTTYYKVAKKHDNELRKVETQVLQGFQ